MVISYLLQIAFYHRLRFELLQEISLGHQERIVVLFCTDEFQILDCSLLAQEIKKLQRLQIRNANIRNLKINLLTIRRLHLAQESHGNKDT